jgi:hypothetical protein
LGLNKQNTKKSKPSESPPSEDEFFEGAMALDDALEWQQWEQWLGELKKLNKKHLIELLAEARDREDHLWSVLLRRNGQVGNAKQEIARLQRERERRLAHQKKGRQARALKDIAEKDEAKALGVDDYYGLLREAIVLLKKNPKLQENKPTKVGAIRAIIVTLLCEPSRSRHTKDQTEWVRIVRTSVLSGHVGTAENQLARETSTSF